MGDSNKRINKLEEKLGALVTRHEKYTQEIKEIYQELKQLKSSEKNRGRNAEPIKDEKPEAEVEPKPKPEFEQKTGGNSEIAKQPVSDQEATKKPLQLKTNLEKFIGENLINKIGIAITVIGVGIGAKYVIENELITPLTRIILGYLIGLGFLGFAVKLKVKYDNFSAVLLSGSMAIMYFITFAAHSFYGLIPQGVTFAVMVLFTAFTALAAIRYDKQVIAHMGLVGAYAVPFLLSDGSGDVRILFTYVSIINIGILVIAFKKCWKPLYYSSFILTWLIYFRWFFSYYYGSASLTTAFIFAVIIFFTFYLIFLGYKLFQKTEFKKGDVILILANAFFFYGIGYAVLSDHSWGEPFLGLFTLSNAVVHFIAATMVYRKQGTDESLLQLIGGLVLVFITIAVPVQLDGNWVTLLWSGEAALLFWIGRTEGLPAYEKLSYPLMLLAFFSVLQDWHWGYGTVQPENTVTSVTPFFNIFFLSSLIFTACFGFINKINYEQAYTSALQHKKNLQILVSFSMWAIFLIALYYSFESEIAFYWNQLYASSYVPAEPAVYNNDLLSFKAIWIINYSLLFFTALSIANIYKLKSKTLGLINLGLNVLIIAAFFVMGLQTLSDLRISYLNQTLSEYYRIGWFNIGIRYISFGFVAGLLAACCKYVRHDLFDRDFYVPFSLMLHICILWTLSSELINWMNYFGSTQSDKLGLSILWGCYSLLLIALGIRNNKKYLRIGAISLFGVTLIKLFLYDIANLDTISKTIVFVTLGILLLIISFLYNKYKHLIPDETEG